MIFSAINEYWPNKKSPSEVLFVYLPLTHNKMADTEISNGVMAISNNVQSSDLTTNDAKSDQTSIPLVPEISIIKSIQGVGKNKRRKRKKKMTANAETTTNSNVETTTNSNVEATTNSNAEATTDSNTGPTDNESLSEKEDTNGEGEILISGTPNVCKVHKEITGIVLIMIVKNESKIIHRCMNSAKSILAGVCITDTGSTDNTIAKIREWGEKEGIPCEVPVTPFRDFGYSRTASFFYGRKYFPNASYYITIDADMELVVKGDFKAEDLTSNGYKIYQQNSTNRYQNIRLLKANQSWRCTCVTHEYWECDDSKTETLFTMEINDRDDGGCKSDKYGRDKRLLLKGLASPKTPDHLKQRYHFYLAQTHLCLGEYQAAIKEYQKRFDSGGWAEECWYSLFSIGKAYMEMAERASESSKKSLEAQAINAYIKAWDYRPARSEPLQRLAKYYRERSMNRIAFRYARMALDQGYPQDDGLFIDTPTYDYLLDFEVAINAFYVPGEKNVGLQSHRRLKNIMHLLPNDIKESVENNEKFYLC